MFRTREELAAAVAGRLRDQDSETYANTDIVDGRLSSVVGALLE